jgi:capsular polysaccharide biosynthesis protein
MTEINLPGRDFSRRRLLRNAALIAGGGAVLQAYLATAANADPVKQTHTAANYQSEPKGSARCNTCSQWIAPTDCKTVQSPVSATGWCSLYVPKW